MKKKIVIAVMLAVSAGLLLYVELFPFPADVDEANLTSGIKNAYTMIGWCRSWQNAYYALYRQLHKGKQPSYERFICNL